MEVPALWGSTFPEACPWGREVAFGLHLWAECVGPSQLVTRGMQPSAPASPTVMGLGQQEWRVPW